MPSAGGVSARRLSQIQLQLKDCATAMEKIYDGAYLVVYVSV
jgi:hypothetical protein